MRAEPFYSRHRGPFRLCVTRPFVKRDGFIRCEWLRETVDPEDVAAECAALLAEKHDRIVAVAVWSISEQQFVMSYPTKERTAA